MRRVALALLLVACADPAPAPRRGLPRSDAVEGCDASTLRRVARALGARTRGGGWFQDEVAVGALEARAAECELGEPFAACQARFARPGRHVWVSARTELRVRLVRAEATTPLEVELAAMSEAGAPFELGREVRERRVASPEVCVREARARRVRVPRVRAVGGALDGLVEQRTAHPEVVFELGRADALELRCAAESEIARPPAIAPGGPCGALAGERVSHAVASRD